MPMDAGPLPSGADIVHPRAILWSNRQTPLAFYSQCLTPCCWIVCGKRVRVLAMLAEEAAMSEITIVAAIKRKGCKQRGYPWRRRSGGCLLQCILRIDKSAGGNGHDVSWSACNGTSCQLQR